MTAMPFDVARGERSWRGLLRHLWLLLLFIALPAQAQTFPKFTGLVVDAANVLPPDVEADLTAKLEALQKDTKRQLVVATIPDLQGYPIEDYGYRLGRSWGVGLRDVNTGVILFVASNEPAGQRGPRIEVGRGLEGIVTDALASQIIRDDMLPRLKANGDIPGAVTAGADALVAQLRAAPAEAQARTDAAIKEFDRTHARARSSSGGDLPIGLIFWVIVLAFVIGPMVLRGRRGRGRAYRGDGGTLPIVLWSIANELSQRNRGGSGWGGDGGWGGGSSGGSDGSWGGGGFTGGGGGDFGGGGASGDW